MEEVFIFLFQNKTIVKVLHSEGEGGRLTSIAYHQMHHLCFKFITTQTWFPFVKQPFQIPVASLFHIVTTSWVMIWFPTTIFYIVTVALETTLKIS